MTPAAVRSISHDSRLLESLRHLASASPLLSHSPKFCPFSAATDMHHRFHHTTASLSTQISPQAKDGKATDSRGGPSLPRVGRLHTPIALTTPSRPMLARSTASSCPLERIRRQPCPHLSEVASTSYRRWQDRRCIGCKVGEESRRR